MQYTIDMNERYWRLTLSGTMTSQDLLQVERMNMKIDDIGPGTSNGLVDLRSLSDINIDYHSVSELAHALGGNSLPSTQKIALLAGAPIQYGYARMFQMLSEQWHVNVEVFEDEKDALVWLSNQA